MKESSCKQAPRGHGSDWMLSKCLFACLLACLLDFLDLLAYLLPCLPACLLACLPAYLPWNPPGLFRMLLELIFTIILQNIPHARTDDGRTHEIPSPWAPCRSQKCKSSQSIWATTIYTQFFTTVFLQIDFITQECNSEAMINVMWKNGFTYIYYIIVHRYNMFFSFSLYAG